MKNEPRWQISAFQAHSLLVLVNIELAAVMLPTVTATDCPRDAWLVSVVATALCLPLVLFFSSVMSKSRLNIVQLMREQLHPVLGIPAGLAFCLFFLLCGACTIRHVMAVYTSAIMPETPAAFFAAGSCLLAGYLAYSGLEVIARVAALYHILAAAAYLFAFVLSYSEMDLTRILPLVERGWRPVAMASLSPLATLLQYVSGGMALCYLASPKSQKVVAWSYVGVTGLFLTLASAVVIAVFGPLASALTFPMWSLTRMVSLAKFVERLEIIPLAHWTGAASVRVGFFIWIGAQGLADILHVRDHRPFVFPLAFLVTVGATFLFRNIFELRSFYQSQVWGIYGVLAQVLFVVLAALAHRAKPRRRDKVQGGAVRQ